MTFKKIIQNIVIFNLMQSIQISFICKWCSGLKNRSMNLEIYKKESKRLSSIWNKKQHRKSIVNKKSLCIKLILRNNLLRMLSIVLLHFWILTILQWMKALKRYNKVSVHVSLYKLSRLLSLKILLDPQIWIKLYKLRNCIKNNILKE